MSLDRRVVQEEEVVAGSSLAALSHSPLAARAKMSTAHLWGCRSMRKTDVLKIYNMHPLYCQPCLRVLMCLDEWMDGWKEGWMNDTDFISFLKPLE